MQKEIRGGLKVDNALVKLSDKHFARAVKVFFTARLSEPCLALCAGARGLQETRTPPFLQRQACLITYCVSDSVHYCDPAVHSFTMYLNDTYAL